MATVTFKVDTTSTLNVTSYASGSFTAAVGDLIVAFVGATATVAASPTLTDSLAEVTFTKITSSVKSGDTIYLFVANGLATSTSSRTVTFDCTGDAATGAIITVYVITGMTRTGSGAVRQSAIQNSQTLGTTPAPAFSGAALTGNPVLGAVANATNPAALSVPAGSAPTWTEGSDSGYATPTTGQETIWAASGFTGTTITWGSTSVTAYSDIIAEFDASTPLAGEDDTPPSLKQAPSEPQITVWQ